MSKRKKQLTEKELETLNAEIVKRKKELFNELLASVARPNGLDDLGAVQEAFDAAERQGDALNRVQATIGMAMMQIAKENKRNRGAK